MTENWLLDLTIEVDLWSVRSEVWIGRCLVGVCRGGSRMSQVPGKIRDEKKVPRAQTGAWWCGGPKKPCNNTRLASFVLKFTNKVTC